MNIKEGAEKLSGMAKDALVRWPGIWDDKKILQTSGATLMTYRKDEGFDFEGALANLIERYGQAPKPAAPAQPKVPSPVKAAAAAASEAVDASNSKSKKASKTTKRALKVKSDSESSEESASEASYDSEDSDDSDVKSKSKKAKKAVVKEKKPVVKKQKPAVENVVPTAASEHATTASGDEESKQKKGPQCLVEGNREIASAIMDMGAIYFKAGDPRKGGVFSKAAKAIRECETLIRTKKEAMALKGVGQGIASYIEEKLTTGMIQRLEEMRAGTA